MKKAIKISLIPVSLILIIVMYFLVKYGFFGAKLYIRCYKFHEDWKLIHAVEKDSSDDKDWQYNFRIEFKNNSDNEKVDIETISNIYKLCNDTLNDSDMTDKDVYLEFDSANGGQYFGIHFKDNKVYKIRSMYNVELKEIAMYFPKVEELVLHDPINDPSSFDGFSSLKKVEFHGNVNEDMIKELKQLFPECEIELVK